MKVNSVKLPKSFLAVNLSESNTFHKKEEHDENFQGTATIVEMTENHLSPRDEPKQKQEDPQEATNMNSEQTSILSDSQES